MKLGPPNEVVDFGLEDPQGVEYLVDDTWVVVGKSEVRRCAVDLRHGSVAVVGVLRIAEVVARTGRRELDHFGDAAYDGDHVWIPVEAAGEHSTAVVVEADPLMAVQQIYDVPPVHRAMIDRSAPWCAVSDDAPGIVYVGNNSSTDRLLAYTPNDRTSEFDRSPERDFVFVNPEWAINNVRHVQGVTFRGPGVVAFTRAQPKKRLFVTSWINHVIIMRDRRFVAAQRKYNFAGTGDEVEGITSFGDDLYVAVADNDLIGGDEFDLYRLEVTADPVPGPDDVTVPHVLHLDAGTAAGRIEAAGLVAVFPDDGGDWVGAQEPAAGAVVKRGSKVSLHMRSGPIP